MNTLFQNAISYVKSVSIHQLFGGPAIKFKRNVESSTEYWITKSSGLLKNFKLLKKIHYVTFLDQRHIWVRLAHNRRRSWSASITNGDSGSSLGTVRPLYASNLSWLWICLFVWIIILKQTNLLGKKIFE